MKRMQLSELAKDKPWLACCSCHKAPGDQPFGPMTQDHAIPIETFERIEAERRMMRASRRNPQTHPSERSFRPSMGQIRILAAIALFRVDAGTQGVQSITKSNGELVEDAALYCDEGQFVTLNFVFSI